MHLSLTSLFGVTCTSNCLRALPNTRHIGGIDLRFLPSLFLVVFSFPAFTEVEDGWFMGQCEQLPNAITQGETIEEVEENMKEAISLVLEDKTHNGVTIPKHDDIKKTVADEICKQLGIPKIE